MAGTNILVIDDSNVVSSLLDDFLTEKGFRVSVAGTAEEAYLKIKERIPDLIVLDLVLPDIHGLQLCRVLKSDPKTRHVPIIMATANAIEVRDKVEGLKAGADDYVTKPFELNEFYERVNAILRRMDLDREKLRATEAVAPEARISSDEEEEGADAEWPGLSAWQKFTSLLTEPGWFFDWMFKGPSQGQEFGLGLGFILVLTGVGALVRLFRAGPKLGAEALGGFVEAAGWVLAWVALSGVLQVFSSLLGRKAQFKSIASVFGVCLAPLVLSRMFEFIYVLAGGRPGEFCADFTLPFEASSLAGSLHFLLARLDIYELWTAVVAGFGLSALLDISRRKSFLLVSGFWVLFVAIGAVLAQMKVIHQ